MDFLLLVVGILCLVAGMALAIYVVLDTLFPPKHDDIRSL